MCLGFLQPTLPLVPKDYILIIFYSYIHNRKVWLIFTWRYSAYTDNSPCLYRVGVLYLTHLKNRGLESPLWKRQLESKLFIPLLHCLPHGVPVDPDKTRVADKRVFANTLISCPVIPLSGYQCSQFTHKETELQRGYVILQDHMLANGGAKAKIWSSDFKCGHIFSA